MLYMSIEVQLLLQWHSNDNFNLRRHFNRFKSNVSLSKVSVTFFAQVCPSEPHLVMQNKSITCASF